MANEDEVESVAKLYTKATENDWRTVQPAAQQAGGDASAEAKDEAAPAAAEAPTTTAETIKLMNVARSILVNENGSVG